MYFQQTRLLHPNGLPWRERRCLPSAALSLTGALFPPKAQALFQVPALSQHRLHTTDGEGGKEVSLQAAGQRPLSRKEVSKRSGGTRERAQA